MNLFEWLHTPLAGRVDPLPARLDRVLGWALAVFGFFLPFSVAGTSITLGALALIAGLAPYAVLRTRPWRDPVIAAGLLLFAFIGLHTLATTGWTPAAGKAVNRYHELLMAVLLVALFRLVTRKQLFFAGLVAGVTAYATAHWAAHFSAPLATWLELRHISAGFAMAVTAYVLLEQSHGHRRPWLSRALAAFLAITVLFAMDGRTGHVLLILLVGVAAWRHSPPTWRWIAAAALPLLVVAAAMGSAGVQKRVNETLHGYQPAPYGDLTSTGIRLELLRNGAYLMAGDFMRGSGYAEYARTHDQVVAQLYRDDPVRKAYVGRYWVRTDNPHSEFLMQAAGGGVLGLALFGGWLALTLARQGRSATARGSLVGLALAFGAGCLFNSFLMDFIEGHVYVALMAWLLAQSGDEPAVTLRTGPVP